MNKKFAILVCVAVLALIGIGCGNNMSDDGLKPAEREMSTRVDQIAKASGGDWDKISQADKDYLVKTVSMGSEPSARMLVKAKSGGLRGKTGGPAGR